MHCPAEHYVPSPRAFNGLPDLDSWSKDGTAYNGRCALSGLPEPLL
jgi:hypothetical protein